MQVFFIFHKFLIFEHLTIINKFICVQTYSRLQFMKKKIFPSILVKNYFLLKWTLTSNFQNNYCKNYQKVLKFLL